MSIRSGKSSQLMCLKPSYSSLGLPLTFAAYISLLFDGTRIVDDQTATDLDMEEGDSIEVLLERTCQNPTEYSQLICPAEVGGW
jgi:hypothetical protein